jgi:hypothetical protein
MCVCSWLRNNFATLLTFIGAEEAELALELGTECFFSSPVALLILRLALPFELWNVLEEFELEILGFDKVSACHDAGSSLRFFKGVVSAESRLGRFPFVRFGAVDWARERAGGGTCAGGSSIAARACWITSSRFFDLSVFSSTVGSSFFGGVGSHSKSWEEDAADMDAFDQSRLSFPSPDCALDMVGRWSSRRPFGELLRF